MPSARTLPTGSIPFGLCLFAAACAGSGSAPAGPARVFDDRVAVFLLADAATLDSLHRARGDDEFYVIADDMNWYRAEARDWLDRNGIDVIHLDGRPDIAFLVDGVAVPFEPGAEAALDLVVLYEPGRAPLALAPIDVSTRAAEYFGAP